MEVSHTADFPCLPGDRARGNFALTLSGDHDVAVGLAPILLRKSREGQHGGQRQEQMAKDHMRRLAEVLLRTRAFIRRPTVFLSGDIGAGKLTLSAMSAKAAQDPSEKSSEQARPRKTGRNQPRFGDLVGFQPADLSELEGRDSGPGSRSQAR